VRSLYLLVFVAGFVTLGMELSASRLLEPAFGNSQIVWAALIGLILLYLALGAWLGGRLADRYPTRPALELTLTVAALGVALIPLLGRPVLRWASVGLGSYNVGLLAGSLIAVLLLFSVPGILLGTASPWAVRLALGGAASSAATGSGALVGRLYAVGTAGSLLGSFLPVLWLIPAVGTRWTFFTLALILLVTLAALGLRSPHRWVPLAALVLVAALAWWMGRDPAIRAGWDAATGEVVYEDESLYNYITVRQWGSERHLKLNDGIGIHSVYHPDSLLSEGIWDYFLLAPLFRSGRSGDDWQPRSLLLIGAAAGTVPGLYSAVYGPLPVTGVELDPQILDVGTQFFAADRPNYRAVAADGRRWLAQQPPDSAFDVIAVDAYRPPYIPFQLTTREFFALARDHLSPGGVLAINVGRTPTNFALVDALAATLQTVFPAVYVIDEPGPPHMLGNSLIVAALDPLGLAAVQERAAALSSDYPAEFADFARKATGYARAAQPPAGTPIFTDDRSPVERVVHSVILDWLTR
jgi:predicted membrane-bound spermidine synthase